MGNNQRLVVFVAIGALMVSIVGTSILLIATGGDTTSHNSAEDATSDQVADIEAQLAEQQAALEAQAIADASRASCGRLTSQATSARQVPAFDLPTEDTTALGIVDLTVGTGDVVQTGDCIVAYYHGVLTDGTVFDSAFERGAPNRFSLNGVIEGWSLGIPGMKEGGTRVLTIPSELAYGESGSAPIIGENADLVFVVELVRIEQL